MPGSFIGLRERERVVRVCREMRRGGETLDLEIEEREEWDVLHRLR